MWDSLPACPRARGQRPYLQQSVHYNEGFAGIEIHLLVRRASGPIAALGIDCKLAVSHADGNGAKLAIQIGIARDVSQHIIFAPVGEGALQAVQNVVAVMRSEEHTSELQSLRHLVCRLLLEKKK